MKRTEKLDREKEVLISSDPNGPVFTTVGDMTPTPSETEELQANLEAQEVAKHISNLVDFVQGMNAAFCEAVFDKLILHDQQRFNFLCDGEIGVARCGDMVIKTFDPLATLKPAVPDEIRLAVRHEIQNRIALAREEDAQKARLN